MSLLKKTTRISMSWISEIDAGQIKKWAKIVGINVLVVIIILLSIDVMAGLGRIVIGKDFRLPIRGFFPSTIAQSSPVHPCNEMKTDVLLSHVTYQPENCDPYAGEVAGEYIVYDMSDPTLPVWLTLGGSTTSGFYQHYAEGRTYPMQLAEIASERSFIVNGGLGGYSSLQEFYKFVRDGTRFDNLEVVISLNGINELADYQGRNGERRHEYPFLTQQQYMMNERQFWIDQRVGNAFFRAFLPNLYSLISFSGEAAPHQPSDDRSETSVILDGLLQPVDAADRWATNVSRLNQLAAMEGARYFVFLQPTMGLEGGQSSPPDGSNDHALLIGMDEAYRSELNRLYAELRVRCAQMSYCHDLSETALPTGDMYSDARHHNAEGNGVIAEAIWNVVTGALSETASSQSEALN